MTRVATLRNRAGHALHCVLHEPPAGVARRDVACLLLSPGVKMRVAPHRLYRKLLDDFLSRGIPVLRVDFHGLGDSGGDLPETQLDQLYRQVQLGRHVDDAATGMNFLERDLGIRRFIIGGLCGGALTGLLAAENDARVVGIYSIGIPVVLDGSGAHVAQTMTEGQFRKVRGEYFKRLFRAESWKRLLSGHTDFRLMFATFGARFGRGGKKVKVAEVPPPAVPLAANLNHSFVRAFFAVLRRRVPALLLFSGADRLQWEYEEKFVTPWRGALAEVADSLTVTVIPGANHIISETAWLEEARRLTREWLDAKLPA